MAITRNHRNPAHRHHLHQRASSPGPRRPGTARTWPCRAPRRST